jgi:pyridoxamine 5'-phosphate oxidase
MRQEYAQNGLAEAELAPDWLTQFESWLAASVAAGLPEPNAMVLATADAAGRPSARTVLLKAVDQQGFVFYTNYRSRKASELAANPSASLVFGWQALGRQVVVTGRAQRVSRAQTEAYFATRPRASQLGAWASEQSAVVPDRDTLDHAYEAVTARFADTDVPVPPHWGGLRVVPDAVEFWQGQTGRLHDRLRYRRSPDTRDSREWTDSGEWTVERLAP